MNYVCVTETEKEDGERRRFLSEDERERHLARRRKNYQLRRQRAEINRIDCQVQAITGGSQATLTSPPETLGIQTGPLPHLDCGTAMSSGLRLSEVKQLVRSKGATRGIVVTTLALSTNFTQII
ncbi:hypothetical protein Bca4012_088585 [Brassica carinata]